MAENTKIEWADHTWNPWMGCTKISPACDGCYAEDMMSTRYQLVGWGAGEPRKRTSAQNWNQPLRWDRAAAKAGRIDTVFCLSLGDIWDNEVDETWRRQAFAVMERTPNLVYLLLSKRIGNAIRMCDPIYGCRGLPSNCTLGATMVNQAEWDRDMPKLRLAGQTLGARFTFASIEPMLGPIDMRGNLPDWVIVGGESGRHARPMHSDWVREIRDQCAEAEIPFHFKQWGEFVEVDGLHCRGHGHSRTHRDGTTFVLDREGRRFEWRDGYAPGVYGPRSIMYRPGKSKAGRLLDDRLHNGFPEVRHG